MADKPPTRILHAPALPETSYELPAYDSPLAEPSPAIREPGRPPAKNRAPARSGVKVRLPGRGERLAPDDRLARPEVGELGEEVIDGVRIQCLAGVAEHADPQSRLDLVVGVCLAKDYVASTELLTRTDQGSDFATDVCVRKKGDDPETGGRYMEEISFEVANTQTLTDLENVRVPKLLSSGVRRIIVLRVKEGDVVEWSVQGGKWMSLTRDDEIHDPVFIQPLEVKAILDAAQVDQLVSKAQLTKEEPHLMGEIKKREKKARVKGLVEGEAKGLAKGEAKGLVEGEAKGLAKGEAKGYAEAIILAFESHNITLDEENRHAILDCQDTELLRRLLTKALVASSASETLAELEKTN